MEEGVWCRGCGGESFLNGLDASLSVGTIKVIRVLKVSAAPFVNATLRHSACVLSQPNSARV